MPRPAPFFSPDGTAGRLRVPDSVRVAVWCKQKLMKNEFTAIYERDGDWIIGYCPEVPSANGQGRTKEECRRSPAAAIELVLEDRRQGMKKSAAVTAAS